MIGSTSRLPLLLWALAALIAGTANGIEPQLTERGGAGRVSPDDRLLSTSPRASPPAVPPRQDRLNGDGSLEAELASEVQRFVDSDRLNPPAPHQVLFVGSSSIAGWATLGRDMAPIPVLNRGFGGSHIEHVNRWFNQIVSLHQPRAIVFYAGENDIAAGKTAARVVADFDAFLAKKTATLGAVPVYFISLKPSKSRFGQFKEQTKVNSAIRARADNRSDLHYVDVVTLMLHEGHPRELFGSDGLHMTPEGYAIWTQAVKAALNEQYAEHPK